MVIGIETFQAEDLPTVRTEDKYTIHATIHIAMNVIKLKIHFSKRCESLNSNLETTSFPSV